LAATYLGSFKASLKNDSGDRVATLIWGDPVHVIDASADPVRVRARGWFGWLEAEALSERSLLEVYVIDVGQGDAILVRTPDDAWHLIDAGAPGSFQMTRKGAANFIRWKFQEDLRREKVSLANVLVSHHDFDHYGGLLDVLGERLADGRTFDVEVENFYHNGLGIFREAPTMGLMTEGMVDPFPEGEHGIDRAGTFVTELLDGKGSFSNPPRELGVTFGRYAANVGQVPRNVRRLSHLDGHLPGYAPGDGDVAIRVLGPIVERLSDGTVGLRKLGSEGVTRNGHSIVLRLDYGRARILLTGDLNSKSHRLLLSYHPEEEFAVDVAKACHHGAEDVDLGFLEAMRPRATVISSGDNESHAHPRPMLIGASGRYGREAKDPRNRRLPPLVYSTELARSVDLGFASALRVKVPGSSPNQVPVEGTEVRVGDTATRYRPVGSTPMSSDLVYGLVNIRTDGTHILCATMKEAGRDFDVQVFQAGEDVET